MNIFLESSSPLTDWIFQVQCKTYDYESGRDFDLTPLINKDGNYHALISEKLQQKSKLPPKVLVSNGPTQLRFVSIRVKQNISGAAQT